MGGLWGNLYEHVGVLEGTSFVGVSGHGVLLSWRVRTGVTARPHLTRTGNVCNVLE